MLQPSISTQLSALDNGAAQLEEPFEAITESDLALDEVSWLALLIQIDREEGGP